MPDAVQLANDPLDLATGPGLDPRVRAVRVNDHGVEVPQVEQHALADGDVAPRMQPANRPDRIAAAGARMSSTSASDRGAYRAAGRNVVFRPKLVTGGVGMEPASPSPREGLATTEP